MGRPLKTPSCIDVRDALEAAMMALLRIGSDWRLENAAVRKMALDSAHSTMAILERIPR